MAQAAQKELANLTRELIAAADSVRDAVQSAGLTYNIVTIALTDLLIEKGLASRQEVEDALTKEFYRLGDRDYEDARRTLTDLLRLLKRRQLRPE